MLAAVIADLAVPPRRSHRHKWTAFQCLPIAGFLNPAFPFGPAGSLSCCQGQRQSLFLCLETSGSLQCHKLTGSRLPPAVLLEPHCEVVVRQLLKLKSETQCFAAVVRAANLIGHLSHTIPICRVHHFVDLLHLGSSEGATSFLCLPITANAELLTARPAAAALLLSYASAAPQE